MSNWQYKFGLASGLFICATLTLPVFAQQQATLQTATLRSKDEAAAAPKPKNRKVWTEDSIPEVRTAADRYQDSVAATQSTSQPASDGSTAAATNQAGPKGLGAPPVALHIPKTAEETQQAIDQRKGMSENFNNLLSYTKEQLQIETDPTVRAELTEKANLLLSGIKSSNAEIKTLEKALEAYKNGKASAQPKDGGQSNGSDAAKPEAQTTAGNTQQ
ncbi:MAG TPA: hypothetical protein VK805_18465 [Candidatus Baltobacteraceae bacterium]|nr:hypothetical protein [Candidatus Baltobacteraceae bacterium]